MTFAHHRPAGHRRIQMPGNLVDAAALAVPWESSSGGPPRPLQRERSPGSEWVLLDLGD